jgi:uncharacterized protein YdbL (DUF1318 family)
MIRRILYSTMVISLLTAGYVYQQAEAQSKYSIKQMTPEVESALENRRARFDKLNDLKSQGLIGENNQGYVEVLTGNADAQQAVEDENKDRQVIYKTIAEQNGLQDALPTIEKVFAQVQYDKAESGQKVQDASGAWVTK